MSDFSTIDYSAMDGQNPPRRRNSGARTLLIVLAVLGLVMCVCVVCCVGSVYAAASTAEFSPTLWTVTVLVEDGPQMYDVVCEGSQADDFSRAFYQNYGSNISFSLDGNSITRNGDVVTASGLLNGDDYEAEFTLGEGAGFLGMGQCIENIRQISPPFNPTNSSTGN